MQLIHYWKWVLVLDCDVVEVLAINAKSLGTIFFLDQQYKRSKRTGVGVDNALLQHFFELLLNLILLGKRVSVWFNVHRLSALLQWYGMITIPLWRQGLGFLKELRVFVKHLLYPSWYGGFGVTPVLTSGDNCMIWATPPFLIMPFNFFTVMFLHCVKLFLTPISVILFPSWVNLILLRF